MKLKDVKERQNKGKKKEIPKEDQEDLAIVIDASTEEDLKNEQSKSKPKPDKEKDKKEVVLVDAPWWKWTKRVFWTIIITGLISLGIYAIYDWQSPKMTTVTMTQPVEGASVQGPLSAVKFSADRKICYEDLSLFKIRNSEDKEMDGVLSMPKKGAKGVKEFSWIPREPLVAEDYYGVLDGDKVAYNTFDFKVFEVEKVLPKETIPTTPKSGVPAESDFLKQLDKNMGNE